MSIESDRKYQYSLANIHPGWLVDLCVADQRVPALFQLFHESPMLEGVKDVIEIFLCIKHRTLGLLVIELIKIKKITKFSFTLR